MKTLKHCLNFGTCTYGKVLKSYSQYKIIKTLKAKFIMVIVLALFVPSTFGQNKIQIIDSILSGYHDAGQLNGNVLIAEKGQIIYNRSFGFANKTSNEKLNENSVFGLASVSKQITAMAIVILKEQGKLSYEDKLTEFFPELADYNNISIRNLLTHTSGLPDIDQLENSREAEEFLSTRLVGNIVTNKDVISFLSAYKPKVNFDPDTKSEYCNIGYVLLASIIEKVSGLSYAEYLDKVIFKPLEMNRTYVDSPGLLPNGIKNRAFDYIYSESLKTYCSADSMIAKNNVNLVLDGPAGIYSTVIDLLKWDRALYTDKLISYPSIKEVFEPVVLNDKTKTSYGFGWFIRDDPKYGKITFHSGGDRGYSSYIERHIDNDKTLIILENYSPGNFPIEEIDRNLYNLPVTKEIKLSQEQMQALSGTYEIQKGIDLRIWFENGLIFSQTTGQKILPLFAENELMLFAKEVEVKLQFEKNKRGEITQLYILLQGNKIIAEKKK